ncbi:MAG: hypothetical protein EOP52_04375 [Sphingobacteriales bacterium]|nr:MAG: hypothetical protein EOP52_04375 [Sphingobacteriales bacterium]
MLSQSFRKGLFPGRWICLLLLVASLLTSCDQVRTSYTGTYKNQPVTVYSREVKGFSTNRITYEVQLGNLPRVKIDALSTDRAGAPYRTDLYRNVPHQWIHNPVTKAADTSVIGTTMLYFDPGQFSRAEYDAYAGFFQQAWPAINAQINNDYVYLHEQVIGTVYGRQDDFVQYFSGTEVDGPYYFDIQPDGAISYHKGAGPEESTGFQGSGLAQQVQMPGSIIRIEDTMYFNRAKLRRYKDKSGNSMEAYFRVVEE